MHYMESNYMLKISYFHTLLQFIDVMNLVDLLLHFSPSVSSMTHRISGANVSVWVFTLKYELFSI